MRCLKWLVAGLVVAAGSVLAGPYEDGMEAVNRQDYETAVRLWQPLAAAGDANAQYGLGVLYTDGDGVPKDPAQAALWFRKAADQGHLDAQYNLGVIYANGEGVPKDYAEAAKWCRKAADQGNPDAQYNLGVMHLSGQGLPKDDQQAYFWFLIASLSGDPDSVRSRALMEASLSADQRAAVQAKAREWKPTASR